jgi:NAD(P)-dependent dehydrogenase (short-subunit alcohol dehydrogenase family)
MDRLKGKTAIVTGGTLGLGHATALRMAEEGARVAILDVLDRDGEELVSELKARGLLARF